MTQDIDDILNATIDLENGFKNYLFRLRCRLLQIPSQQALDQIMDRIFPRLPDDQGKAQRIKNVFDHPDHDFQYTIPNDIGPKELIEKIIEYELQHYHFYADLKEVVVYTRSQGTCDLLIKYKVQQVNDTRSVLDGIELAV